MTSFHSQTFHNSQQHRTHLTLRSSSRFDCFQVGKNLFTTAVCRSFFLECAKKRNVRKNWSLRSAFFTKFASLSALQPHRDRIFTPKTLLMFASFRSSCSTIILNQWHWEGEKKCKTCWWVINFSYSLAFDTVCVDLIHLVIAFVSIFFELWLSHKRATTAGAVVICHTADDMFLLRDINSQFRECSSSRVPISECVVCIVCDNFYSGYRRESGKL